MKYPGKLKTLILSAALAAAGTTAPTDTITLWRTIMDIFNGYKTYIVVAFMLLAGLQSVPAELYEACKADGGNAWKRFRHVSLPMLRPISVITLLLLIIWTIRDFAIVYVMAQGGPSKATEIVTIYIYRTAFISFQFGQACAAGVLMLIVALLWVIPSLGLFITSFRSVGDSGSSGWWTVLTEPSQLTLKNYVDLLSNSTITSSLWNTVLIVVPTTILVVLIGALAAYAFARLRFPGKDAVFAFMLTSMMIPGAVTLIPSYVVMTKIAFVNTYWSLLVPSIVGAGNIFLLTQFLKAVPRELEEAAFVDGASRFRIYKDVVLPLARPALLTVFILQFQGMWNAFLAPLLYLNSPRMWVLNVAISTFQQQYKAAWNLTLVAAMFNAMKLTHRKLDDLSVVCSGAGAAGIAIIKLLIALGLKDVVLCDRQGAIYKGRGGLNAEKAEMAEIITDEYEKINQRHLQQYAKDLG